MPDDLLTPDLPGPPDPPGPPVEGPESTEATELQASLKPPLSPELSKKLANMVLSDHAAAAADRRDWEARLVEWDNQYYGRVPDKIWPWPGCSNFHVPLTMLGIETYKPRLVEAVLGQYPPILLLATREADAQRKDTVEQFLNWQITVDLHLEPKITEAAHLFLLPGIVYVKTVWQVMRTKRKFVREYPASTSAAAIFEELFGATPPTDLDATGKMSWRGTIPASHVAGGALEVSLAFKYLTDPPVLQVLVEREDVTERPAPALIDPLDVFVPMGGGSDIATLPFIQHRLWMTEDDLRRRARLGQFTPEVVEELLKPGPTGNTSQLDSAVETGRDAAAAETTQGESAVLPTQWVVIEDYRRLDIDGDGFEEEVILWASPGTPDLLGWDYLDNVYCHGRRPIRVARFFPVPFRWYGLSFAEVVKAIQDETNTIHNQRVDYGTLQNLPFGVRKASSGLPAIAQRIRPGEFLDVDNVQDIAFPKFQGSPAWGLQEESTLFQYFERLSGLTDLAIGRQPNRVGATRTAAGTQALLSESGLRFKIAMQAFQRFWVEVFEDILALDQEYLPPNTEFRVTGRVPPSVRVRDRSEIRGRYDLHLAATAETLNRQSYRQDSTVLLQALLNPAFLQLGIVGVKGIRRAVEDALRAFGKDPTFYLEDRAVPLSPTEELMHFLAGRPVSPTMGEDFQAHMTAHAEQAASPALPPVARRLLAEHIQQTQQMMQMAQMAQQMQQRQAQQQIQGPQAPNAQVGATAPAGPPGTPPPGSPGGAPPMSPMLGG